MMDVLRTHLRENEYPEQKETENLAQEEEGGGGSDSVKVLQQQQERGSNGRLLFCFCAS